MGLAKEHFSERKPLTEVGIDDILMTFNQFTIRYQIFDDCYGRIKPQEYIIYINPLFNQDGITATHELMHYYFDFQGIELPEESIETLAQEVYNDYQEDIDYYVRVRLNQQYKALENIWIVSKYEAGPSVAMPVFNRKGNTYK